jgi:hypothetical protein
MGFESIQPPKPFQAEYEGSIPFTRSIPSEKMATSRRCSHPAAKPLEDGHAE